MIISSSSILRRIEPLIYGRRARPCCVLLLTLMTALMLFQAARIQPDASFEKSVPLQHPYMEVFQQYQAQFGGANTLLVALMRKDGDIYDAGFLARLRTATDQVFFTPGIDRAQVTSLFTRNVRFIEVVDGGFSAGNVIPADYAPSDAMFDLIRSNVAKAKVVGLLVSSDQKGAMVRAEVLDINPVGYRQTDHARVARQLEDQLRGRFMSPTRYLYRLKHELPPYKAGDAVAEGFHDLGWKRWFTDVETNLKAADGKTPALAIPARKLTVEAQPNPEYDPDLSVHIIGFSKLIGDVTDATLGVVGFFLLTIAGTMIALRIYLGDWRLALLPLCCSLVAVVWEFGLLKTFGFGLDPFAIMVPFLVLAVSTSHGVQYVNTWADEVLHGGRASGRNSFDASLATFRRLFIPGSIALITNVAGFLTIYLVPIGSIREMSLNACLGMFAVIVTNKVMMPVWLSYLSVADVEAFRRKRQATSAAGDGLWRALSVVTSTPVAAALIAFSLLVFAGSWWLQQYRIVGDAQAGVPELRPDSQFNRDVGVITRRFDIGTDVLKVIAETDPWACINYEAMDELDRFTWMLRNAPGVRQTYSLATLIRQTYSGLWESHPAFQVIPRMHDGLVLATKSVETSTGLLNGDCSAIPVLVFTADHRATTIAKVVAKVEAANASVAQEFFEDHPEVDAGYCTAKTALKRELGGDEAGLQRYYERRRGEHANEDLLPREPEAQRLTQRITELREQLKAQSRACPVHFALATGNVGVMAATNAVVEAKELPSVLGVYAVILLLVLLSYRSLAGLLAIGIPLLMVSVFANALMAVFGVGLKVATLPVITLAVGIGVDYGIYIYDVLRHKVYDEHLPLREAYVAALRQTGKAVIFTGLCLAGGVSTWLFSALQFQRDMGLLLVFMFTANMLGAVLLGPAYCRFLMRKAG